MRSTSLALFVLLPVLAFSACIVAIGPGHHASWIGSGRPGSGVSATQTRLVPEFHALRIEGSCDAKVAVGGAASLEISADDNLIDDITTEVVEGVLVISMKDGANDSFRVGPRATISVPSFDCAVIQGSGDVDITGVNGESLEVRISGSGDLNARGKATKVTVAIDGSGDIDLGGLESLQANVSINGSGDVRVRCSQSLTASVSGSGDVDYLGGPAQTHIAVSGSGDVRPVK
ncbi:MAG TPA: head GIN domain-containing protein [Planctomycetota bacterium]|nr:head GIN domain-containing protein [Planctomycetota bacterium]